MFTDCIKKHQQTCCEMKRGTFPSSGILRIHIVRVYNLLNLAKITVSTSLKQFPSHFVLGYIFAVTNRSTGGVRRHFG